MIRLTKPYIPISAIKDITEIIASGNLVQGIYVNNFEMALGEFLGRRYSIAVSSGTAALHLSLLSLNIGPGDEVIVPTFTFPATANVVVLVGAKPVFVDINLNDFCIDIKKIEKAITSRTKAIMPVHEFGQAADMDGIMEIAQRRGLWVIEDAACALGTEYANQKVGTFGIIGCFSFHPRKAITTGEGGLIVTNDDELAIKLRALRNLGLTPVDGVLDFHYAGTNYRMTEVHAAMGLAQLEVFEEMLIQRQKIAELYDNRLRLVTGLRIPLTLPGRKAVYQTYHVLFENYIDRNAIIDSLREENIETNYGAQALNCIPFYQKEYGLTDVDYPHSARAFRKGLALPIGSHIDAKDVEWIAEVLEAKLVAYK